MDFILSILESIGFNWHVAIVNFINFLLILFILNKFVFKKVFSGIESRQDMIKQGLENASEAEKKLQRAIADSQNIMSDSKKAAENEFKNIIDRAEREASDINLQAGKDAELLKSNLNEKIANAEAKVQADFTKIAPALVANLLKKTLGDIDEATHDKLIANLVR